MEGNIKEDFDKIEGLNTGTDNISSKKCPSFLTSKIFLISAVGLLVVVVTVVIIVALTSGKGKDESQPNDNVKKNCELGQGPKCRTCNPDNLQICGSCNEDYDLIEGKCIEIVYSIKGVYHFVTSYSLTATLINPSFINNIEKMRIIDEIVNPVSEYAFSEDGHYPVYYTMKNANYESLEKMFKDTHIFTITFSQDFISKNLQSITNTESMFENAHFLNEFDFSFDTSKITSMAYMFSNCFNLRNVNFNNNFKLDAVISMSKMFYYTDIREIILSNLNAPNLLNMDETFSECNGLWSIDLSNLNAPKLSTFQAIFKGDVSLKYVLFNDLKAPNLYNIKEMFSGCSSLSSIDLSFFKTQEITEISSLFKECSSLTSIILTGLNTQKVTDMSYMFDYCTKLKKVDLSSLDTENLINMEGMFNYDSALTSLDLSMLNFDKVENIDDLFDFCTELTYLDISSFKSLNTELSDIFYSHPSTGTLIINRNIDESLLSGFDDWNIEKK